MATSSQAPKPPRPTVTDLVNDPSKVARWAGPVFVVCSLVLIPWIVYLGLTLPSRQLSRHYDIAWVGFDVMELLALGATGLFALRHSRYLALTSAAAATLLIVDAWFDVLTSNRHQLPQAIVLAVLIELPLATICGWLSYHTETLADQRIALLVRSLRRGSGRPARRG
jgi:hypothetical protein